MIIVRPDDHRRANARIVSAGTPVMAAAVSSLKPASMRSTTRSQPTTWVLRNSKSTFPSLISTAMIPNTSAASVPGRSATVSAWSSAADSVAMGFTDVIRRPEAAKSFKARRPA